MMTAKNIAQAKADFRPFINLTTAFKALLTEHELPLSLNIDELTAVLRAQLFAKLLAVDAGLKMRFEMLRTEEAQQQLILSTIDLNGYEIVDTLKQMIAQLQQAFSRLSFDQGPHVGQYLLRNGKTLHWLLTTYEFDIEQWLESERIDWTGKEHVLAYFTTLASQLQKLRSVYRTTVDSSASLQQMVGPRTSNYFTQASNNGPIEPCEYRLMEEVVPKLEKYKKLAGFPGNMNQ